MKVSDASRLSSPVRIDVRTDAKGEYFDVQKRPDVDVQVLDVRGKDRHLLLLARESDDSPSQVRKSKFLCGHDERSWFVAAIPEVPGVRDVESAKVALRPQAVRDALERAGVRGKRRHRRRNDAFVRQGEWFFLPRPELVVDEKLVLRNEPIRRGGGKPHLCEMLYRRNGRPVYVSSKAPNGLSVEEYHAMPLEQRRRHRWQMMVRDADVYVKGKVRHPDHQTIELDFWHLVRMNTETQAAAMRHVAFLD